MAEPPPAAADRAVRILDEQDARWPGLVDRIYEDVLLPSFRPEELGPAWKEHQVPAGPVLVVRDRAGREVLGCAVVEHYPASDTLLLGYLAVRPGFRDGGVGTALMHAVVDRWCDRSTVVLAEVDDPRHHQPHPSFGDPWARLRFYRRFGLMALAAPYFQPRLDPGLPRAYHLMLCRLAPSPRITTEPAMDGDRTLSFLREYFVACEGPAVLDDPQVRWLLDFYHDQIPLVPLTRLEQVPHPDPPEEHGALP